MSALTVSFLKSYSASNGYSSSIHLEHKWDGNHNTKPIHCTRIVFLIWVLRPVKIISHYFKTISRQVESNIPGKPPGHPFASRTRFPHIQTKWGMNTRRYSDERPCD